MKVFVSAAEISSDIHAEKILKSLADQCAQKGITLEWMGVGGPRVSSLPGFRCLEPAENLRTMGFIEVLGKIPYFQNLLDRLAHELAQFRPDLILTFDYPDFHFRLMERVKREELAPGALKVCGIPPKVWVWRSGRVNKIRDLYDGVWVIFPFEKSFYESHSIPVIYEGNPLLDPLLEKKNLNRLPAEVITVMPGSREGELKHHLPVIPRALEIFSKRIGKPVQALVPVPNGVNENRIRSFLQNTSHVSYEFFPNGSEECLRKSQMGLIKSGTSTLEASILGCIPVIFYRMNPLSEWIFRIVIKGIHGYLGPVGLPNILLGVKKREDSVFPELLGPEASSERLAESLARIYSNEGLKNKLNEANASLRALFLGNRDVDSSSNRSALAILNWWENRPSPRIPEKTEIALVSFLWSALNRLRRGFYRTGLLPVRTVRYPSILVGNLQAGGAGKTPVVIALAKEAVKKGKKVVVISRGYGREPNDPLGDEPREILAEVPEVKMIVDSDRINAIQKAEQMRPDLILFDDGFQNLQFKAHKAVLLVTDRSRNQVPYRDFDSQIQGADVVIGTKGKNFRNTFTRHRRFFQLDWQWENPIQGPVWLLCGIADPSELIDFYQSRGLQIRRVILKSDHAQFDLTEVNDLLCQAEKEGCLLAITSKDRVKIPSMSDSIYVLRRSIANRDWIETLFADTLKS